MSRGIAEELQEQLDQLAPDQQRQVLDFARALATTRPRGRSGQALIRFAGTISREDLALMSRAIEEGCEQVNPDEW